LLLRMSRRDIASLPGVSHETVSRSFTALADWGCLRVEFREIEILVTHLIQGPTRRRRSRPDAQKTGRHTAMTETT
jgi:CRP/FNR family transcriptional regulator